VRITTKDPVKLRRRSPLHAAAPSQVQRVLLHELLPGRPRQGEPRPARPFLSHGGMDEGASILDGHRLAPIGIPCIRCNDGAGVDGRGPAQAGRRSACWSATASTASWRPPARRRSR
jgi:hypothetical protein